MDSQENKALENLVSQKKKSLLKTQLTSLCGERTMRLSVMQSGMRLVLMSIEKEFPETERTEKYCGSFVVEGKTTLLNFMKSG